MQGSVHKYLKGVFVVVAVGGGGPKIAPSLFDKVFL